MKMVKKLQLFCILLCAMSPLAISAQYWATAEAESRAKQLVSQMTLDEKLAYIGGYNDFYIRAIKRLGIPEIKMSDGPQGLRNDGKTNAMPSGILLAATWSKHLSYEYGKALGEDSKARGVHILLGPGVNIYRAPMCGRNFEYFGEDPYLASQTSVQYIKGLQDEGVMATVKHFAANNQEWDRHNVSSDVDERTLHEIYFPAFKASIQEAEVGAVMHSYNLLNGIHASQHKWLLTDVLRNQWGFKGILMSDWNSVYNCKESANNGLDLEMPNGKFMSVDSLKYFIQRGEISVSTIDEKVTRILRTLIGFGFFDKTQKDTNIPLDNPSSAQTALEVAREGIVLLKNEKNILPLRMEKNKTIAIVGDNASQFVTGGGSGWLDPFHFKSILDGVNDIAKDACINIIYVENTLVPEKELFTGKTSQINGLKASYFNNKTMTGKPVAERIDSRIDFNWNQGAGLPAGVNTTNFSVRWEGVVRPTASGEYEFIINGDDGYRLYIDNQLIGDNWLDGSLSRKTARVNLIANKDHTIKVEYYQNTGEAIAKLEWRIVDAKIFNEKIKDADLILACVGYNSSTESEGYDRSFYLTEAEDEVLYNARRSGKPVVAVVNAGGNVGLEDHLSGLDALIWAWFPGQEGGRAVAEILFGKVNPSGKLPATFEKTWKDNPTYNSYHDPDGDKRVQYTEGIFVGYRGYDKNNTEVQFPFGYGLSYTTFDISDIKVNKFNSGNKKLSVSCKIRNTGKMRGAEVVQLYVGKPSVNGIEQPVKELRGYEKVNLSPNETKTVTFELSTEDLSYYNVDIHNFDFLSGTYKIMIGNSSRNIKLTQDILLSK